MLTMGRHLSSADSQVVKGMVKGVYFGKYSDIIYNNTSDMAHTGYV